MTSPVELVQRLAAEPAGLTREELVAALGWAEELRSWTAGREGRFIRELRSRDRDPSSPARDTAGEVEREQKCGVGQARRRTERAEQLADLPQTESALEQGAVTEAHVDVLTRARAGADAAVRAALAEHEAELLAVAAGLTPRQFQDHVARFVKNHSADDGRSAWERKKARQLLRLRKDEDGMTRGQLLLAPEEGQITRRVLHAIADELYRRDHADHPADQPVPWSELTQERRLAEAFVEACRRAEQFGGVAKSIDRAVVVLAYDDLVGRDGPAAGTSTLADGTPVPASVARRLACEAGTIPFVLGGPSVKLDYGRSRRLSSPAQDEVLRLLWATCSFADCQSPVDWTHTHHTNPFNDDGARGKTDIGELTPVCRGACHGLAHTVGWQFSKDPHTHATTTIAPDGTTWHRQPNGPATKPNRPAKPPEAAATHPGPEPREPAATLFTTAA